MKRINFLVSIWLVLLLACGSQESISASGETEENDSTRNESDTTATAQKSESYFMFVASSDASDGVGIATYQWVPDSASLRLVSEERSIPSSSYLSVDTTNSMLYSINGQGIYSFQINDETGELSQLNRVELTGRGPCYVSVSNNRQFLMVAYYSSGSVSTYQLMENGSVGTLVSNIEHEGSSVNQERQEAPHAHMIYPAPNSDLILVPDLGIDKVMVYEGDEEGKLSPAEVSFATIRPGGGPRHLAFHPDGKFVFVLHELTGHVTGFTFDSERGITDSTNTLSTLPAGFTDFNKSADIHVTPNGQYLYASNRGHNSIAIFEINQASGRLFLVDILDCGGDWPRAFDIDPSGDFLMIANKRSNHVSIMKIDYSTGLFEKVGEMKTSGEPQGIRFGKVRVK